MHKTNTLYKLTDEQNAFIDENKLRMKQTDMATRLGICLSAVNQRVNKDVVKKRKRDKRKSS